MSAAANTSIDYEDEVFDDFEDAKPVKAAVSSQGGAVAAAVVADDDLISAAHLAKKTNGAGVNAGSDEELEPVHIQLSVNVQGSDAVVLKFDDSISYDEFKKRLAAIGCDKVTYKNLTGKDITISDERQLDYFIDMMVDDFEGENKLKGAYACSGYRVAAASVIDATSKPIPAKTADSDLKAPPTAAASPEIVAASVKSTNSQLSATNVVDAASVPQAVVAAPSPSQAPGPKPIEAVAVSAAEAIQAHGEFKPVASLSAYASALSAMIASVREGSMKSAWQHMPQLRLELSALDTQRVGAVSATEFSTVLTRVLNLQATNFDVQTLLSVFGGDTGCINIEQLLLAFIPLSPSALKALDSIRNSQLQNGPSVSGLRTFNCSSMACGHSSTLTRCAVLDLCLENSKDSTAPSTPASSLLSKYSSTSHKIDLAALSSICAEVGGMTDVTSMSINPFVVTRNLALATQQEVALITQSLIEQTGRRAVLSVAETLLAALRATSLVEKKKSMNPFASSKPVPKPKTEKVVLDAMNSGCAGSADALSHLMASSAPDNLSLIAFVEGLHWVDSTGVFSDVACSTLGKNMKAVMDACVAKDTQNSGVIPLSAFIAILSQHPIDPSIISSYSSTANGHHIDYRHLLFQRILVLTIEESVVLSSWISAPQQSLRTFLVAHSHVLNTQFVAAASKANLVPRKTVKSCITKLPAIGTRSTEQLLTQLLDGCTGNSTSDPDVMFLDTMTTASVRLLQLNALQDAIFLSRSAISVAAAASGIAEDSFPLDVACKLVASAIPPHHSSHDVSSFLCQFCSTTGSIQLYRAIQSLVRLPVDAHEELGASFHGPSSALVHQLCTFFSLHGIGAPASAGKPIEEIASAPGIPLAKAIYKAVPSLTFGHGALSTFLARISKGGLPQVSVKGFLQQFTPAVAVLSPAILVLKPAQVSAQGPPSRAAPAPPPPATAQVSPQLQSSAQVASQAAAKPSHAAVSPPSSVNPSLKPGLARARANFRKLIRVHRPSSLDVLRMLGVSTSLFPSALSVHEASGKGCLATLLKTTTASSNSLQLSGMWPVLKNVLPCSVLDLRVTEAKSVPSAGASHTSVNRKVRVTFCNGIDGFFGSLAAVSAKTNRGDDHTWQFPSAQILSTAVSKATMDAYPNGGLLIELSIVVTKKTAEGSAAVAVNATTASRDMSAGWAMIPWAELKPGTKTLTLTGGVPWAQQKIQPEDCGSKKGFFGLSKAQAPVSSVTVSLVAAGEAAHYPDKCVCSKSAVHLLQLYALYLRSQVSAFFGQSSAVRPPVFHNLLLSAFPLLISEAPLRRALVSKWSELGGNSKVSLATLADPQNRDVLEQIKILHKAVSLLQPLLHVHGLHWGVAALQEDDDLAAKKERIVQAFAVNPIEFLSGKESSIEHGAVDTVKFEPVRAKELCFTIQMQ